MLAGSLLVTVLTAAAAAGLLPGVPDERFALAADPDDLDRVAAASLASGERRVVTEDVHVDDRGAATASDPAAAPPADSGQGRRVVFDMSDQRVWLVRDNGRVAASHLVSGSRFDNLAPGTYEVYSRSRHATSFDSYSSMRFMVRFTQGHRAAIGFHDIPRDAQGQPVQSISQLGTPQSAGCIRQRRADARRMWQFATLGTPVVVTA